jgi:hypothetical protein
VDVVVQRRSEVLPRAPGPLDGQVVWAPFVFVHEGLVTMRQVGHLVERPYAPVELSRRLATLRAALGPPVAEDDEMVVFLRR